MVMPSKFAEELLEKIDQGDGILTALEIPEYEDLIDAELQEVREVIALIAKGNFNQPDVIARARALMEKLEVK